MSFWFKPRQIVIMDAQSSGPARNFNVRYITLFLLFLLLTAGSFAVGAWYAPFHQVQQIIPENIKLKRQNAALQHKIEDVQTTNHLKDEQLASLKEQIDLQEIEIVNVTKQLHMYQSILDERKGTGIHVLESSAKLTPEHKIEWKSLFVKGGSYPRYLKGKYQIFALDDQGNRVDLNPEMMHYKIESHIFVQRIFDWKEHWKPTKLELVVYNSRLKEVLRKIIPVQ
jgi:hypothetical protein